MRETDFYHSLFICSFVNVVIAMQYLHLIIDKIK